MNTEKSSVAIWIGSLLFLVVLWSYGSDNQRPVGDLEEVLRIQDTQNTQDTGINFYFKSPHAPVIDKMNALYVLDRKQLIKFDKTGTFIGNYYKDGLGPGEANDPSCIFIRGDHFVLYNIQPPKFLWFSQKDGTLKRENRLSDKIGYSDFVTYYDNRYFFFREDYPRSTKSKAAFVDVKVKLLSYNIESETFKDEDLFFPKKYFLSKSETGSYVKNVNFVQVCLPDDHTILVANNGNYEVQCLDLKGMKIFPFIKREYKKVPVKDEWKKYFHPFRFPHTGPKGIEYKTWVKSALDDIQKIFKFHSKVWVVTSTFDEQTRLVNIDVFDLNGKYIDTFLLKTPVNVLIYRLNQVRMTLHDDELFIFESSEDGDFELAGYKLKNVPGWAR